MLPLMATLAGGEMQGNITKIEDFPHTYREFVEEFTFRFNRRNSRSRGLVFRRLIEQVIATEPVTETDVTFGYDWNLSRGRS